MTEELIVLLGGREVGRVRRNNRGRLSFVYDEVWRKSDTAYPLSLSIPLAAVEHGPDVVEAFIWGLLPDNEQVLERWARKFHISARNVFALISHVGEDCAGAVQFVSQERLDAILGRDADAVEWLAEKDIAERLRTLRNDHSAWRLQRDAGQFSLAGAQPKTALLLQGANWGIPSGRIPTTHILKPPTGQFDGHAENEHICLAVAHAFGLPTASSKVMQFGDEIAIVVERYDRIRSNNEILRVHQEDICQALAIRPSSKYQNEGGPGIADIVELLRTYSSSRDEDVHTFITAIGLNWLIAGTDAHAKNYSLLISSGSRVRLAPLYDIASILPYDGFDLRKAKLAMKIGGQYELNEIGIRQWQKLAREIHIDPEEFLASLGAIAERMPDEAAGVCAKARKDGLNRPIIDRLENQLHERAEACLKVLTIKI